MKFAITILGIFLAITFVIPVFWVFSFSPWGWLSLFILSIANYIYLFSKSSNMGDIIKHAIPLALFLLFYLGIGNWAHKASGHPLGIGLAAGFLIFGGLTVLAGYLEIVAIRNLTIDLPKLVTLFGNWQGTFGNWLALVILLPLGTHLYVLYQGGIFWYWNEQKPTAKMFRVHNQSIAFEDDGIKLEGGLFHKKVREGRPVKATVFSVGGTEVLFQAGEPVRFYNNGEIRSGTMESDTSLIVGEEKILFSGDYPIEFYPDGKVNEGLLAQDLKFTPGKQAKPVILAKGRMVEFYNDGLVKTFDPDTELLLTTGLNTPLLLEARSPVTIYRDGSLASGTPVKDTSYPTGDRMVLLEKGIETVFYENGCLKQASMAQEISFPPVGLLPEGTRIVLGRKGELLGFRFINCEFYLNSDGKMLCKQGFGSYNYQGEEIIISGNEGIFVRYGDREITEEDFERDVNREIDAIGYYYQGECIDILAKNEIEILPEYEEIDLLVMFRYRNVKKELIREILFLEPTIICYQGKNIVCQPYEWVRVR